MTYDDNGQETPFNEEDELAALDTFEDSISATAALIHRLMAIKKAVKGLSALNIAIDDLSEHSESNPEKNYSNAFNKLETRFENISAEVEESTIPDDNSIHQELHRIQTKLHSLSLDDRRPDSTPDRPTTITHSKTNSIQLPKLHLPTFNGDLMEWAPFWSQFRTAVDSNSELSEEHKLAYLRDAITDQSIRSLMFSGAE